MQKLYRDDPMSIPIGDWVKWVVLHRDHYQGNAKGEYFAASDYDTLKREQPFWFLSEDRPVYEVVLTDEDVPSLVKRRGDVIRELDGLRYDYNHIYDPARPKCDGRKTRRTAPEAYAQFDEDKAKAKEAKGKIKQRESELYEELGQLPFSSTLYHIRRGQ
ncbi:MAG: hypothetical protein J6Y37_03830 [Paludibacteraceae bacterium]|nr:hypothetical protein [Paludibacteraceae bacterium]